MATKHQKFSINVSSKYDEEDRLSITRDVIEFVQKRTSKGINKENKKFKSEGRKGYSKAYANSKEGKAAGKQFKGNPNLTLTSDMLVALGEYVKVKPRSIEIGDEKGSPENAKADGNVRGTYGKSRGRSELKRDFMGITKENLEAIKSKYQTKDEKRKEARAEDQDVDAGVTSIAEEIAARARTTRDA